MSGTPHVEFLRLSRPSLCLSSDELANVDRHVEVFGRFLDLRAQHFVARHADEPLLEQFFSDGTPFTTQERETINWDTYKVTRAGRECKDYLMQRVFLSSASGNSTAILKEPRLMHTKHHLVSYQGMTELWQGCRMAGAKDVVVSSLGV